MNQYIKGLHHVTAMTSDAQKNVDFYAGILGLKLVKKTVNFDAPDVWHLYFGNDSGDPGTIITFFPFPGMPRGRKGNGQVTVTSFSVGGNSLDYWMKRLEKYGVTYRKPLSRFNEEYIYFEDFDGLGIELVAGEPDGRKAVAAGIVPEEHAIRGFNGVTLSLTDVERTVILLTDQMEHRLIDRKDNRYRYSAGGSRGGFVDVVSLPDGQNGLSGAGTVHHVAFATDNDNTQLEFRDKLLSGGMVHPTRVADRQYFHSIYFREPGGVLFEAATCDIGFTLDESVDNLGESLKLPPWEEKNRSSIEKYLPHFEFSPEKFREYARV